MLPAVTNMAATAATFKFKDEESDVKFLSYFNLVLGLTTIFVELVFLDRFRSPNVGSLGVWRVFALSHGFVPQVR